MSQPVIQPSRLSMLAALIGLSISPFGFCASPQSVQLNPDSVAPEPLQSPLTVMRSSPVSLETLHAIITAPNAVPHPIASDSSGTVTEGALSLNDYFVSEKLDGIRAIWDGVQLKTRQGNPIYAPDWFTRSLPRQTIIEGELWIGRGQFQTLATIIRDKVPNAQQWQAVNFMLFDAPSVAGPFKTRLEALSSLSQHIDEPFIRVIEQRRLERYAQLETLLKRIDTDGGEGVMLHHKNNAYQNGISNGLIKLRTHQDSEAIIVGYEPGKGKYTGKMGAIWVQTSDNIRFKIGSGFSDLERANPPPIGSTVQFRFNGYTDRGIPRFARFIRLRESPDI